MRIEYMRRISISDFKRYGLITERPFTEVYYKTINWMNHDDSEVEFTIKVGLYNGFYLITYQFNGRIYALHIVLEKQLSNLGKGNIYYFICPITGKSCRNLYFYDGLFGHRTAFKDIYYLKQTKSKNQRAMEHICSYIFGLPKLEEQEYEKWRKKHYKGKTTKWFKLLKRKMNRAQNVSIMQYRML